MKLKPCPFCGSSDVQTAIPWMSSMVTGTVYCNNCNIFVYIPLSKETFDERKNELIEAWNRRAGE